jgi:hypothetical protein
MLKTIAAAALLTTTLASPGVAWAATDVATPIHQAQRTPTLHIECYYEPLVGGWACTRFSEDGTFHSFWIRRD